MKSKPILVWSLLSLPAFTLAATFNCTLIRVESIGQQTTLWTSKFNPDTLDGTTSATSNGYSIGDASVHCDYYYGENPSDTKAYCAFERFQASTTGAPQRMLLARTKRQMPTDSIDLATDIEGKTHEVFCTIVP